MTSYKSFKEHEGNFDEYASQEVRKWINATGGSTYLINTAGNQVKLQEDIWGQVLFWPKVSNQVNFMPNKSSGGKYREV